MVSIVHLKLKVDVCFWSKLSVASLVSVFKLFHSLHERACCATAIWWHIGVLTPNSSNNCTGNVLIRFLFFLDTTLLYIIETNLWFCLILIWFCIPGSIATGAAPKSLGFSAVSLGAVVLTGRMLLWQTSRNYSFLFRVEGQQVRDDTTPKASFPPAPFSTLPCLSSLAHKRSSLWGRSFSSLF